MTEKKAPVMPDLVRHLGEKSGKDSGFNPYGLPQNDSKKKRQRYRLGGRYDRKV